MGKIGEDIEEKDYFEEDSRHKVITELTDDKEVDAAMELIEEKFDAPEKDTASKETEPEKDTSEKPTGEQTEADEDKLSEKEEEKKEPVEGEFILTDDIIQGQPEEFRGILEKYKGKGKEELAKAAANAIALKNPYMKGNEAAIKAATADIQTKTEDEILKTLIEAQAQTGLPEKPESTQIEQPPVKEVKIELPQLPDDKNFKALMDKEVVKQLRKKYPDMPEDFESEDYDDWEKDLLDTGLSKANVFLRDKEKVEANISTEFQKIVYAKTQLTNLYNEDPTELLGLLTTDNLPKLKQLNDDYKTFNNQTLESDVAGIKAKLGEMNISEKDLGFDLTLTKDSSGNLHNDTLDSLLKNGNGDDPNIIWRVGKVPIIKKGELVKKFIFENNAKILTQVANKKFSTSKLETERLKDESLKLTPGSSGSARSDGKDITKITSLDELDKIAANIEGKY